MKKLYLLLISTCLFSIALQAQEDTVQSLIFSEWRSNNRQSCYVEMTNMGEDTLDLSKFTYVTLMHGLTLSSGTSIRPIRLSGELYPGDTYLMMNVFDEITPDGRSIQRTQMLPFADLLIHVWEPNYLRIVQDEENFSFIPEKEMWGFDSISSTAYNPNMFEVLRMGWKRSSILYYHLENGDSVLVDGVNHWRNTPSITEPIPVAGVADATGSRILVRKFNIKTGNTEWEDARGIDAEDSEWILLPHDGTNYDGDIYTTVGNHGDYDIVISSESVQVDMANEELTVPWGVNKGDSIRHLLNLGDGMAWHYVEDTIDFNDSLHTICQEGDILSVYAVGNTLEEINFSIKVFPPSVDMAAVFPVRTLVYPTPEESALGAVPTWGGVRYAVSEYGGGVMDTISNIPFATRVDTLFKYLEWAPEANAEIVLVDGSTRADLKDGDLLKITAEDGSTTKSYYLKVEEYEASENANLSAITWPDKNEFLEGWAQDTIPRFSPVSNSYTVTLPYGTKQVPVLVALPQNLNATVVTKRAESLKGSMEQRTTIFTVTAEVDTVEMEYKVLFNVDIPPELRQEWSAKPFLGDMGFFRRDSYASIANPGTTPINLSRYMIVKGIGITNPGDAIRDISNITDIAERYQKAYVPGYKFSGDTLEWEAAPNKLYIDPATNSLLEPGEVFAIGGYHNQTVILDNADIILWDRDFDNIWNPWGEDNLNVNTGVTRLMSDLNNGLFLFKIMNDSILEGSKEIGDPADFELIDIMGFNLPIAGRDPLKKSGFYKFERKPHVLHGVTTLGEGFGTSAEDSDWIVHQDLDSDWSRALCVAFCGTHPMDPYTGHISTVSSLVYKVDAGFEGDLMIEGMSNNETVEQFFADISKGDTAQAIKVVSTADGTVKGLTDAIVSNDTLVSISADSTNVTRYILSTLALDDDAVITLVNPTSILEIEINGESGLIKGVTYGGLLSELLDSLVIPATANANILDQNGELVPLKVVNFDTVKVDTRIGDSIYIEVVAQNGTNKITYKLQPEAQSSDAFVVSSMYSVDQESRIIANIAAGTSVSTLWGYIEVVRGGSAVIIDKLGFVRTSGLVAYDDRIKVVSEDESATVFYNLNFLGELNPDLPNQAPVVSITAAATGEWNTAITFTGEATDDGLPEGAGLTYLWEVSSGDAGSVTIANADQSVTDITFSALGDYELSLAVSDGELSTTVAHNINVTPGVGLEQFDVSDISIFPNPATERVYITLPQLESGVATIRILSVTGKAVFLSESTESKVEINISRFDSGVYFVAVSYGENHIYRKLNILK